MKSAGNEKTGKDEQERLVRRYRALTRRLASLGPVLVGTIAERTIEREDPDRPGAGKRYGPYYQWTFKKEGKTVTVNLSRTQVAKFRKAIERNRILENTVDEMRALSRRILDASTKGVTKRKRRDSK